MRKNLIVLAVIVAAVLLAYLSGEKHGVKVTEKWYADHTDTTTTAQIDTCKAEAPVPDTVWQEKPVPYPVYLKGDTEYVTEYRDSIVYVTLPRTVKEYRKENYYARVSGIDPSLDYIETYNKTITNTVHVPQKVEAKKSFAEIDARLMYDKMPLAPLTFNVGRRLGLFEVYAGAGYDFAQNGFVGQVGFRGQFEW